MNPVSRFDAINRALTLPGLSPTERVVLTYLVQRMRTSGRKRRMTWVQINDMAEAFGVDRKTVSRSLVKLTDRGVIQRWRRPNNYDYRIPPVWDEVASD